MINSFSGEYAFLSNFWYSPVLLGHIIYPTVEHAYQAAKTLDINQRSNILLAPSPGIAKRMGQKLTLRSDWEQIKRRVMLQLLRSKFQNQTLRDKLVFTLPHMLIEGNTWHDNYWGMCNCHVCVAHEQQENWLGKLLMHIRFEYVL